MKISKIFETKRKIFSRIRGNNVLKNTKKSKIVISLGGGTL